VSPWLSALYFALLITAYSTALHWAERRWACTCGRSHLPYFNPRHGKTRVMVAEASVVAVVAVAAGVDLARGGGSVVMTALMLLLFAKAALTVYYHEKGKRKRSILRGLGRVVVNEHGRLAVQ
jgi:hypothetical protein